MILLYTDARLILPVWLYFDIELPCYCDDVILKVYIWAYWIRQQNLFIAVKDRAISKWMTSSSLYFVLSECITSYPQPLCVRLVIYWGPHRSHSRFISIKFCKWSQLKHMYSFYRERSKYLFYLVWFWFYHQFVFVWDQFTTFFSGLLHWFRGNNEVVPVKQPCKVWVRLNRTHSWKARNYRSVWNVQMMYRMYKCIRQKHSKSGRILETYIHT